jgi:hypothetical protein
MAAKSGRSSGAAAGNCHLLRQLVGGDEGYHDELRKNQQQSISEQKNYLVERIELAQHAILSKLTSNTVNGEPLDESISEMENRLSTLVEQIQAHATAAVLDRLDHQAQVKNRWSSADS